MGPIDRRIGWAIAFVVLPVLSIPWFLWGNATVIAGVPLWLWWHAVWMVVAAALFWLFARRAWGTWIVGPASNRSGDRPGGDRT